MRGKPKGLVSRQCPLSNSSAMCGPSPDAAKSIDGTSLYLIQHKTGNLADKTSVLINIYRAIVNYGDWIMETCANCRFSAETDRQIIIDTDNPTIMDVSPEEVVEDIGNNIMRLITIRCQRYPPSAARENGDFGYPLIRIFGWCGEYKKCGD